MVIQTYPGFIEGALSLGLNPDDYECVMKLSSNEISFAFHKDTSDSIILKFQDALNK
ncbi:MAG: hypothetical protein HQK76_03715 [Desulfobacterales bacterium]|nr:hypothetical protein [Desulfobacterales bacterium]